MPGNVQPLWHLAGFLSQVDMRRHLDMRAVSIRLWHFLLKVLSGFRRNQGLLLSGALAYYSLLSIVPLLILTLIILSHVMPEELVLSTVSAQIKMLVPGYAAWLTEHVRVFLEHRGVVGLVGFVIMLFFSSLAFTTLEKAISVIFFHRVRIRRRHFLISAFIPYLYMCALGAGIVVVSFLTGGIETLRKSHLEVLGTSVGLVEVAAAALYALSILVEILLLTSVYLVMPVGRITFRHAMLGGVTATFLWEATRRLLVWYFGSLSLVNIIYGSLAAVVVALLTIEAAAVIVLLGAQVIAEYERETGSLAEDGHSGFET